MSWWVCRVCPDHCCQLVSFEPRICSFHKFSPAWAKWHPATPEDTLEIVAYANLAMCRAFKLCEDKEPAPRFTKADFGKLEKMAREVAESKKRQLELKKKLGLDKEPDDE